MKFPVRFLLGAGAIVLSSIAAGAQTPAPTPVSQPNAPAVELTLEQSIMIALRQNGDTRSADSSFTAAQQNVRAVRSDLYPQVNATADYAYSNQSGTVTTINSDGTSSVNRSVTARSGETTTAVSLSQNLFDSGRTKANTRQAEANALGAAGSLGTARNSLAYEVAQRYYEQLRQARLVVQRQGQVSLAQSQLDLVQAQFKAGAVARSDIQSVLVNLAQTKLDLSTAQNDLRVAQTNFRNSLGLGRGPALTLQDNLPAAALPTAIDLNAAVSPTADTTAKPAVPAASTTVPTAETLDSLDNYVSLADHLRPDIVQAQATVSSAEQSVKLAKIDANPQVTASAGYSIDPRDTSTRGFTFSTGLSIPIFDAGGLKAGVRSSQSSLEAAKIRLEQTRKDVAADVEAAYIDLTGQDEQLANARALLEQARVNLENATAKYRAGAGIILDIVNAQTQLFNAQNTYTGILYNSQISRFNLDRATGRFAWADPDEAAPATAPTTLKTASETISHLDQKPVPTLP